MSVETLTPGTRCPRHAMIAATRVCDGCGRSICERCVLPQSDGTIRCLCCTAPAEETFPPPSTGLPPPSGQGQPRMPTAFTPPAPYTQSKCVNHPEVEASCRCSGCGVHICGVCDFRVTGGRHACPACVMKEPDAVTPKRRNLAIIGCVLAVWSTVSLGLVASGYFASMVESPDDLKRLELAITFLVFLPTVAGFAFSMSSIERHQPNSTFLWVSTVWNALLLAGYMGLTVIGTFS